MSGTCMCTCYICHAFSKIQLAALHYNENANCDQAITKAGEQRYNNIVFPKDKKGDYIVHKVIKDPTYGKGVPLCVHWINIL